MDTTFYIPPTPLPVLIIHWVSTWRQRWDWFVWNASRSRGLASSYIYEWFLCGNLQVYEVLDQEEEENKKGQAQESNPDYIDSTRSLLGHYQLILTRLISPSISQN